MNIASKIFMASAAESGPVEPPEDIFEDALKFDGDTYLLRSTLDGTVNSSQFILSFWFRSDQQTTETFILNSSRFELKLAGVTNRNFYISLIVKNQSGTQLFAYGVHTNNTLLTTVSTKWNHVLMSVDVSGVPTGKVYINDIESSIYAMTTGEFAFGVNSNWSFGRALTGIFDYANIGLQYFYLAPGKYLDLSLEANRRKFTRYSDEGQLMPMSLGVSGELPTGSTPAIFMPFTDKDTANLNLGYGGNFSTTGNLIPASNSATDDSVEGVFYYSSSDYIYYNLNNSGMASDFKLTINFNVKFSDIEGNVNDVIYFDYNDTSYLRLHISGGKITFLYNPSGTNLLFDSVTKMVAGTWYNFIISLDAQSGEYKMYINDVSDIDVRAATGADFRLDYGQLSICSSNTNMTISEFFLEQGLYLDLDVEANRRKFINADLTPANTRQLNLVDGLNPHEYLPNQEGTHNINYGTDGNFSKSGSVALNSRDTQLRYSASPYVFDGTKYLTSYNSIPDSDGADGTGYTISFWINVPNDSAFNVVTSKDDANPISCKVFAGFVRTTLRSPAEATLQSFDSLPGSIIFNKWTHVVLSVDTVSQTQQIYIDNVDALGNSYANLTGTLALKQLLNFGVEHNGDSATEGVLADLFIYQGYLDISDANVRAHFIHPIKLNPAGNLMLTTEVQPTVYLLNFFDASASNVGNPGLGVYGAAGVLTSKFYSPSLIKAI